jgi:glycosyltransferase involved in cell wall biosynthesis
MATYKKYTGTVSVWSNSYDSPTGYGQQVKYLVDRLKRSGIDTANISNYGLEGTRQTIKTPYGKAPHFARGFDAYSNLTAPKDHKMFTSMSKNEKSLFLTLYDVWVLNSPEYNEFPIASWTPLDHLTLPPNVESWVRKDNVTPIAMSPFGLRQFEDKDIDAEYIPHGIETKFYKPTFTLPNKADIRDFMQSRDKFVVGMVAANKSSGLVHRKAFSENILAFSIFHKKHPDSMMYIHTDPMPNNIGWNLVEIIKGCGIPMESVAFPNPYEYRYGIPREQLAAFYTGMDVLLAPSYGEGFGVPTVEAQACGTPVIGSGWAATQDLVSEDGWLVDGQPQWDSSQSAWWRVPNVPSIVDALEMAYNRGKERSQVSIDFAKKFDVETVWTDYWQPYLDKVFG